MILIAHPQATSTDHSGFRTSNLSIEKLDVTTSLPLLLIRFPIFKAEDGKKTKFDPRLQDGCVLPKEYMPYPPELLNTPLEDMDEVRRQLGKVRALIWLQTKVRTDKNNYKNFWYFEIFFYMEWLLFFRVCSSKLSETPKLHESSVKKEKLIFSIILVCLNYLQRFNIILVSIIN